MRVVITGASGFLGRYLLEKAPDSAEILALTHRQALTSDNPRVWPIQSDLRAAGFSEFSEFNPDLIIHCAAMARLDACEADPILTYRINRDVTKALADFAAGNDIRMIFTSTDCIYDGLKGHYSEDDPPNPLSVYAKSKWAAEQYLLAQHPNALSLRLALIYGKSLSGQPTFTESAVHNLRADKPVNLFVDEIRNPIQVSNLAEIIWELAGSEVCGALNVGGPERLSRYEMGEIICRELKLPRQLLVAKKISEIKFAYHRAPDCSLQIGRLLSLVKTPLLSFAEAIRDDFL